MRASKTPGLLEGQAVVVTGAGGGLGRAYALMAAREGAGVVVNDVLEGAADAVVDEIRAAGGRAIGDAHSVSDWNGAAALVAACVEEFGTIDGLVNNAGVSHVGTPGTESEDDIRAIVDVNLLGTMFCSHHAVREMLRRGSGSLVNIASTAVWGARSLGIYGATKGGVSSLTYSWALDLSGSGVRVNVVSPFAESLTLMNWNRVTEALGYRGADRRLPELGAVIDPRPRPTPENNAAVVVYLLASSTSVSGQLVQVHGDRLSIVARPVSVDDPPGATVQGKGEWDVESVRRAFEETLAGSEHPVRDYRDPL